MKKNNILSILLSILIGLFVFFVGTNVQSDAIPNKVYQVYLNGNTIGLIKSEDELLDLINEKQKEIKTKYNVDKVYPPSGIDIKETYTYSNEIISAGEIYNLIQNKDPFTINGYVATIKYPDEKEREIKINVLNKLDFQEAFKTVIKAFVGSEEYRLYESDSQLEIVDTGSKIEKIYWDENITIKEDFISVDELIFDNTNDISRYLLFGTLEDLETYEIKTGDDIKSISYNNMLSTEEFLIVNPKYTSEHVLLIPGERVNIGLIKPLVTVTAELHVVEDLVYRFETEYVDDKDAHYGTQKTIQEGSDGITRVTEKVLYKNGEIQNMIIIKNLSKEIKPVINKIISRGTKSYSGSGFQHYSGSTWVWPTVNPCLITSKFAPRWGSFHNGIDISGPGFGSPIYSSTEGKVISIYDSCPSSGDGLKDNCGGGYGNNVKVLTSDGNHTIIYAHLIKGARVKVGDTVKRNQIIGGMGNSGRSSGTHLHYEIINNKTGSRENPCSRFNC